MGADNTFGETNFNPNKIMDTQKEAKYNQECGLSKFEWEMDQLADRIIESDSSLERIGILRAYSERICREQREACAEGFKNSGYNEWWVSLAMVQETPLLTDNK